jgi:hypothetical protein
VHGAKLRVDLADGMSTLPSWMQELLRPLAFDEAHDAIYCSFPAIAGSWDKSG